MQEYRPPFVCDGAVARLLPRYRTRNQDGLPDRPIIRKFWSQCSWPIHPLDLNRLAESR